MAKKKVKVFSKTTSVRLDGDLLEIQNEILGIASLFNGESSTRGALITLSDLLLFELSYVDRGENGLLSRDEEYLKAAYAGMMEKTSSNVVTLSYDDEQGELVGRIIGKLGKAGIKVVFAEAVRLAVYEFARVYRNFPEEPLTYLALLISLSRPVYGGASSEAERKKHIVSARFPDFPAEARTALKDYYSGLPESVASGFGKDDNVLKRQGNKARLVAELSSGSLENIQGRTLDALRDPVEVSILYVALVAVTRARREDLFRKSLGGGSTDALYNPYAILPQSNSAFSILGIATHGWTKAAQEIPTMLRKNGKIREIYDRVLGLAFTQREGNG